MSPPPTRILNLLTKHKFHHFFPSYISPYHYFSLHHHPLSSDSKMSQQQRPQEEQQEPIKYGDVFNVSGELASKPIPPQDAAAMQAAETIVLGQTQKGGPAATMQSAANKNEAAGFVAHEDASKDARDKGVTISEADVAGTRIITESVGDQVVGQYIQPTVQDGTPAPESAVERDAITIGEALEATALAAGYKSVDQSDAAAIQAAEVRATGRGTVIPGGIGAAAQSAATANARIVREEEKTKLGDVLQDARSKLPRDKAVTGEDAEAVVGAEIRNNPDLATHPGGVAASVTAAARLNKGKD